MQILLTYKREINMY